MPMRPLIFLIVVMFMTGSAVAISCSPPVFEVSSNGNLDGKMIVCDHVGSFKADPSLSGVDIRQSGDTLYLSGSPAAGGYIHVYGDVIPGMVSVVEGIGIKITVPGTSTGTGAGDDRPAIVSTSVPATTIPAQPIQTDQQTQPVPPKVTHKDTPVETAPSPPTPHHAEPEPPFPAGETGKGTDWNLVVLLAGSVLLAAFIVVVFYDSRRK